MQDNRVRWLAGLLIAAVAIGLIAAWLSRGEFKGRYALPEHGAESNAEVAVQPAPRPLPAPALRAAAPAAPPPVARPAEAPPQEEADDDVARMARAIDRAARKALERGEPVRWHKAGERGYVVVSEPRDDGTRVCRNVSATINRDGGPAQSDAHMWCMTPDGDWEPAE